VKNERFILVVDDVDEVRGVIKEILESAGYKTRCCNCGSDALTAFGDGKTTSALVSDIEMPVMDGFMLATALRKLRSDLKIIFITGSRQQPPLHLADCPVLGKPVSAHSLLTTLRRELNV
jgi:CheY-like chemotaxis protein